MINCRLDFKNWLLPEIDENITILNIGLYSTPT